METFFYLEGAYLILSGVILLVTLFVTTRSFMSKGALKRGMAWVSLTLAVMIAGHYYVTTSRMAEVRKAFNEDMLIVCESRMQRKAAQAVRIRKSNGWQMEGDNLRSPYYERPFFIARCIVEK